MSINETRSMQEPPVDDSEQFTGGVNSVRRVGSVVIRPKGTHSPGVHALLRHVRNAGFVRCPEPISLDATTETLSFLPGTIGGSVLEEAFASDAVLVSAAHLLRDFHAATAGFDPAQYEWMLPTGAPVEVMCHNDFTPYNCVVNDDRVTGLFDFDTLTPGPRIWDVAYAAYRWAPLTDSPPEGIREQARRLKVFCDAYGNVERVAVLDVAVTRLETLIEFMTSEAKAGNVAFQRHIQEGHVDIYLTDIDHIRRNKKQLA